MTGISHEDRSARIERFRALFDAPPRRAPLTAEQRKADVQKLPAVDPARQFFDDYAKAVNAEPLVESEHQGWPRQAMPTIQAEILASSKSKTSKPNLQNPSPESNNALGLRHEKTNKQSSVGIVQITRKTRSAQHTNLGITASLLSFSTETFAATGIKRHAAILLALIHTAAERRLNCISHCMDGYPNSGDLIAE